MKHKIRTALLGASILLGVALASALPANAQPPIGHGWNKPAPTIPGWPTPTPPSIYDHFCVKYPADPICQ